MQIPVIIRRCAKALLLAIALHPIIAARGLAADAAALEAALATVTAGELKEHAGFLADDTLEGRAAGSRGGRAAAHYLALRLKEAALQGAGDRGGYQQPFSPGYVNVLGKIAGADPELKDECIVVGAHYDHVGYGSRQNSNGPIGYIHNGADDNASGVAAVLEMIDALGRTHWRPRRTILFAFWDGEEINLLGSRHWVRQPTVPLSSVRLAVNADMVGRMTKGRLEIEGTRTALGLRKLLSSERLPADMWLDFTWEYQENSDHWPFFEAGIPSLLIHTGLHQDYHRPSDDLEKLNIAGLRQATAYTLEAVCKAADADALPSFRPAARSETAYTRSQREAPLGPTPPRLGLRWDWSAGQAEGDEPYAVVTSLTPGGAAEQAGVRVGDRIVAVDGAALEVETLLPAAVLRARGEVTLRIVRGSDEPQDLAVPLAGRPVELGLSWREDAAAPGAAYVTRVVPYSPAARAGLAVYDRMYAVNGEPFADGRALMARVESLLEAGAESIQLEIESFGHIKSVDVDLRLPSGGNADATL
ncbi:MAG: M20/M25/M40 family metallo-hydrolase [Pirellulales bacterium]|nr:M20/M25/M40 family metallo-hydrolase [Pirellulales bacterium]